MTLLQRTWIHLRMNTESRSHTVLRRVVTVVEVEVAAAAGAAGEAEAVEAAVVGVVAAM